MTDEQKEYKFIGLHADELEGGVPVAPGDYTGPISNEGHNATLINEGLLVEVPNGTAGKVAEANAAAAGDGESGQAEAPKARRGRSSESDTSNERTQR